MPYARSMSLWGRRLQSSGKRRGEEESEIAFLRICAIERFISKIVHIAEKSYFRKLKELRSRLTRFKSDS
jgi:hypothetical protein